MKSDSVKENNCRTNYNSNCYGRHNSRVAATCAREEHKSGRIMTTTGNDTLIYVRLISFFICVQISFYYLMSTSKLWTLYCWADTTKHNFRIGTCHRIRSGPATHLFRGQRDLGWAMNNLFLKAHTCRRSDADSS
jgi:hypothetical protein